MRAVIIEDFSGVEKLKIADISSPIPADNEVKIEVIFAAANPIDFKIGAGHLKTSLEHRFPIILGWDAAGVVCEVGKNVKNFKKGDEVFAYCRKPVVQWGTFAEYVCMEAQCVALKPKNLSFAQAAAIPLTALTAWQALFDFAKLKKDQTILIHAGAGGVGGMAIQFARECGAKVITTASSKNHDYVEKLGANYVIDYEKENFLNKIKEHFPQGVDVAFDTVGGKSKHETYEAVKAGGQLITIVEPVDDALANKCKIHGTYVFVSPNGVQLNKIAELISSGKVSPPAIEELRLEEAKDALAKLQKGHTRGKIVLKVK